MGLQTEPPGSRIVHEAGTYRWETGAVLFRGIFIREEGAAKKKGRGSTARISQSG